MVEFNLGSREPNSLSLKTPLIVLEVLFIRKKREIPDLETSLWYYFLNVTSRPSSILIRISAYLITFLRSIISDSVLLESGYNL